MIKYLKALFLLSVFLSSTVGSSTLTNTFNFMGVKNGVPVKIGDTSCSTSSADFNSSTLPAWFPFNGTVYFIALDCEGKRKLFKFNEIENIVQISNINPGLNDFNHTERKGPFAVELNEKAYFWALNAGGKYKLFRLSKNDSIEQVIEQRGASYDDAPFKPNSAYYPVDTGIIKANDKLYVPVLETANTYAFHVINEDHSVSKITPTTAATWGSSAQIPVLFNNKIHFPARSAGSDYAVLDLNDHSLSNPFTAYTRPKKATDTHLYIEKRDGSYYKLYRVDKSDNWTKIGEFAGASAHDETSHGYLWRVFNGEVYFSAKTSVGAKLFKDNGSVIARVDLNNSSTADFGSSLSYTAIAGDRLYFTAVSGQSNKICYITKKSSSMVCIDNTYNDNNTSLPIEFGNTVVVVGLFDGKTKVARLYPDNAIRQLSFISSTGNDQPNNFFVWNNTLYFTAGSKGYKLKIR